MIVPSSIASDINWEFLRKEAKSLLKLCRSHDAITLARIRAELPRLAEVNDTRMAIEIKLADIQHALAHQYGYASWADLKRHHETHSTADFSIAGNDGNPLPEGFSPWSKCVSYTVRPEILSPLKYGHEYRIVVRTLGKDPEKETTQGYAALYNRAVEIANGRVAQFKRANRDKTLHSRILNHGWFTYERAPIAQAFLTVGLANLRESDPVLPGVRLPTSEELATPGGMTPDNYTVPDAAKFGQVEESYSCGMGDPSIESPGIFLVSYGEYVSACEGIDYKPFVERAESLARFHVPFLDNERQSTNPAWKTFRREWFCVTNPDIAVVHIYLQPSPEGRGRSEGPGEG